MEEDAVLPTLGVHSDHPATSIPQTGRPSLSVQLQSCRAGVGLSEGRMMAGALMTLGKGLQREAAALGQPGRGRGLREDGRR